MNQALRSIILVVQIVRTKALTVAFVLASTALLASAQASEPSAVRQDPPAPATETAKVEEADAKKNADAAENATARFTNPRPNAVLKNPFAEDAATKPLAARKQSTASEWQFAFTPYLYMTGVSGTIGARGRTAEVDMSFGDVIENLNLGLMGTLEARKGRFVVVNDLMWIKLGEERPTPGSLYSSVKLGVNMFVWDPEVGYRLYEGKAGSFDVLGGFRLMSIENNVNFRAGALPAVDVSERKTWATPVIGGHGTLNLSPKLFLATKFDIGGGVGADITGQFYGGGGYRITPKIALVGGYRYLTTDYDSEAGFLFDTSMNGVLLGAKFTF